MIGHKDVGQHRAGTKHSLFFFRNFFFFGLINANVASRFAEDPEFTINAYLLPTNFANSY